MNGEDILDVGQEEMYSICVQLLSDHILRGIKDRRNKVCKIEYIDEVPYIFENNRESVIGIEGEGMKEISQMITTLLHLFCVDGYQKSKFYNIPYDKAANKLNILWDVVSGYILECKSLWGVYKLNDMRLYEMVYGNVDRLLLLLLIDPLKFIARMGKKINESSLDVQEFFSAIEASIGRMLYGYLTKYLLMRELRDEYLVGDIILVVIKFWAQSEVVDLETKMMKEK